MPVETKQMSPKEILELKEKYKDQIISENQPDYTHYQFKIKDCTITAYTSGKVVFQGKNIPTTKKQPSKQNVFPQAGSDEVGTGDFFGPVVVAATIIQKENEQKIRSLGVDDSKTMTDIKIREVAPLLQTLCEYSVLIVSNEKYNAIHETHNLNSIKAKLHNQAYVNLVNKGYTLPSLKIIDQFAKEDLYYQYIQYEPNVIKGCHFETKAEHKYLSVASASVLARYAFLKTWDEMEEKYNFTFPKGAGSAVDTAAQEFVNQYGFDALKKVAKIHFKNTDKICY